MTRPPYRRDDCPFCLRIDRNEYDGAWLGGVHFEPLNPVTPGHRLFVTTRHESPLTNPLGYSDEEQFTTGVESVLPLLWMWRRENGITESYNLILNAGAEASQTVEHTHLHYVPRRSGDGLVLPWTHQEPRTMDPALGQVVGRLRGGIEL